MRFLLILTEMAQIQYISLTVCVCVCMCDQLYMYACVFIAEAGLTVCVCMYFESRSLIYVETVPK